MENTEQKVEDLQSEGLQLVEEVKVEVSDLGEWKLSVKCTGDKEFIDKKKPEIMKAFRQAPVKGWRLGKAPDDVLERAYKDHIKEALKRALTEESYHAALFQKKLRPYGAPTFKSMFLDDDSFSCEFEVNVTPDFELVDLKTIEIPRPHEERTVNDIAEQILNSLRVKHGVTNKFKEDEFLENGDSAIVSYDAFVEDSTEKDEMLSSPGELMKIGDSAVKEFDENLLGMKIGEIRDFTIVAPENSRKSLDFKKIRFVATLVNAHKVTPMPLDDSLAHKMGKKDMAEVRELVQGSAINHVAKSFKSKVNSALAAKLIDLHQFTVPSWLKLAEAQYLASQNNISWEKISDAEKEEFLTLGEKNVKLSLVLDKVRKDIVDANLPDKEVLDIIKRNVSAKYFMEKQKPISKDTLTSKIHDMNKTGHLQILTSRIKDEYTMDEISKNIKLVE